jgi:hypothetical protein
MVIEKQELPFLAPFSKGCAVRNEKQPVRRALCALYIGRFFSSLVELSHCFLKHSPIPVLLLKRKTEIGAKGRACPLSEQA